MTPGQGRESGQEFLQSVLSRASTGERQGDPERCEGRNYGHHRPVEDVTGSESLRPEKALLLGPCKVIPQEYPHLTCRLVDVELPAGGTNCKEPACASDSGGVSGEPVSSMVAYRGPHRWIQTFEPIQCQAGQSAPCFEKAASISLPAGSEASG